jgi:hypothetical protein
LKRAHGHVILSRPKQYLQVEGFTYADWTGSSSKRQSITGYCTPGNLVTWKSKEERVMAQSSAKAEYRAMVTNRSSFNTLFIFMQAIQIRVRETKIYTKFEK